MRRMVSTLQSYLGLFCGSDRINVINDFVSGFPFVPQFRHGALWSCKLVATSQSVGTLSGRRYTHRRRNRQAQRSACFHRRREVDNHILIMCLLCHCFLVEINFCISSYYSWNHNILMLKMLKMVIIHF